MVVFLLKKNGALGIMRWKVMKVMVYFSVNSQIYIHGCRFEGLDLAYDFRN